MRTIDGSQGEGGGSILRLAAALALIVQEPLQITNIRKNRPTPGLRAQHLMGLRAVAELCGGQLENARLGAESVTFRPANDWHFDLKIPVSTAGSIGLILQTLQIAALAVRKHSVVIEFQGGATFGKWAPSLPYIDRVTWAIFRLMKYQLEVTIKRHGFYPKGGAHVMTRLTPPRTLTGFQAIDFLHPTKATVVSIASTHLQQARVAERQSQSVTKALKTINIEAVTQNSIVPANNPGSGIVVASQTGRNIIGGDFVGEKKLRAEKVGQNAFERYHSIIKSESTVDPLCADQLLPIMGCASSSSGFTTPLLSTHTQTNIQLVTEFLNVEITTEKRKTHYHVSVDV